MQPVYKLGAFSKGRVPLDTTFIDRVEIDCDFLIMANRKFSTSLENFAKNILWYYAQLYEKIIFKKIYLYNYFSAWYGVDQLAARKEMRVDQLDVGNKYMGKISDLRRNFYIIFYRIDFSRM